MKLATAHCCSPSFVTPSNLPYIGPFESGTHCHLDPISDHRHPSRLAHLEPELRGPDSLADSADHHLSQDTECPTKDSPLPYYPLPLSGQEWR